MDNLEGILSEKDVESWKDDGFLKITNFFDLEEMKAMASWVEEIASWPPTEKEILQHFELIDNKKILSRSENFIPFHEGMREVITKGKLVQVISEVLGQQAVLYKEKINYKYPKGGGYAAHQDAPAYNNIKEHVSCLISIDPATVENGCLEFVRRKHNNGLIALDEKGCIENSVAEKMDWESVETEVGDILIFHSYAPHRSAANNSSKPRRAIYMTFNDLRQGDLRQAYYDSKIKRFKEFKKQGGEKAFRISMIGHFQGSTTE